MAAEIPVWVGGVEKWVTGVTRHTTCHDLVSALLKAEGYSSSSNGYAVVERWKQVERPLEGKARILKVWKTWGDEKDEVRFTLKKIQAMTVREVKGGRRKWRVASNVAGQTVHPKRLKNKDDDSIQRLLKMILVQGDTIREQLQRLQEKQQEIDRFEEKLHRSRMEEVGTNYLLETYLGDGEAASNDSGVSMEGSPEVQTENHKKKKQDDNTKDNPQDIQACIELYEKVAELNERLEKEEEKTVKLVSLIGQEQQNNELVVSIRTEIERINSMMEEQVEEMCRSNIVENEVEVLLVGRGKQLERLETELVWVECESLDLQRQYEQKNRCNDNISDDTGLSSLSSEEVAQVLDTLV